MESGKRTIGMIFERGRNLEIPFFQRAYVWDTEQWQRFLEDMRMVSKTKKPYFLGSVILKQQETTSDQSQVLTVIDGELDKRADFLFKKACEIWIEGTMPTTNNI